MSNTVPLFLVDAFAEGPFSGNPAGVCPLSSWPADAWLQAVAAEMNQSETAFLVREGAGFRLRWFTPQVEVDLCGHATLASARVLWDEGLVEHGQPIDFQTRSGTLSARQVGGEIELNFPLTPQTACAPAPGLLEALGAEARYVGKSADYLIEVADEAAVRALQPDFRKLGEIDCRGIIVTAPAADDRYDFVSRFFAPRAGIDEDPVTGSAHCTLADYWQQKLGKSTLRAFQASRRGGSVGIVVEGDRVRLSGAAIVVVRGELLGPPA